ncbi:beta-galactosidase [Pullulanibacillus sp. KACC 23026]|uniref:beta-galactosidase n=1 Tax=Pullulanibacillus sp. KACC 23026 TaxID=3028315 RepID=UPI0023B1D654|nr:beta-galactosidase [Pullulanibacillus sp. KACC 23026]WEG11745.1 beta-galactosidase [Pullulanibacillus sp. KACC 23026]
MINTKLPRFYYGGDYNPEQWTEEVWEEDLRLFKLAKINIVTINVFTWSLIQSDETTYNFEWLDKVIDHLYQNGISICLATGTANHPAWMAKKYPDVLSVDFEGRKRKFGFRHNSCPNSPSYQQFAKELVSRLVDRYGNHPAVSIWHVNNEMGCQCYCENCEAAFRIWLEKKYGTLKAVNKAWNTRFWGHTFYDWDEIVLPNLLSEHLDKNNPDRTAFQGITLDYYRFNSDSVLDRYLDDYHIIRKKDPQTPITTNYHGHATYKPLDYFKWSQYMDIVAWDNYPAYNTPISTTAFRLDMMRGFKNGDPFLIMEQTPSQQNWQPYNSLKRPNVMRLWSYQALAHGANSVMFFQLRRSIGACEKFHGAVIEHAGHEQTRVFQEVSELGRELKELDLTLLESRVESKVALLFDWENWWAVSFSSGPTDLLDYVKEVQNYYDAFFNQNIQVDIINSETDLSKYDLVMAPVLYMVKPGLSTRLEAFVQKGGLFVTTFFSGIVNENDLVTLGGYPGELRKLLGIWVEEMDALFPDQKNQMIVKGQFGALKRDYECGILCDLLHSEGAEVIAEFGDDFYKGMPCLTKNQFGKGEAWYVATSPESAFLEDFVLSLCKHKGIKPIDEVPRGIEVTKRTCDGQSFLFYLNHTEITQKIKLKGESYKDIISGKAVNSELEIPSKDLVILTEM